jgi:hypothetical protein
MLVLTPEAMRGVLEFVVGQDAGAGAGLRISPGPHSAVERTWDYSVVHEPFEGDLVIEDGPARVSSSIPMRRRSSSTACWTLTSTSRPSRHASSFAYATRAERQNSARRLRVLP